MFKNSRIFENESLEIKQQINSWRALHLFPLQDFKITLAKTISNIKDVVIVQRLKRLPTILNKLQRFKTIPLVKMQDIGGTRVICKDMESVRQIENLLNNKDKFKYELIRKKDYIQNPKDSGYRGVHIIYKYINNDNKSSGFVSNELYIELQIRTQLQHIWATTVEVMGILQQEDLKSSIGNQETLDFFALCSSAFALLENTNTLHIHNSLSEQEIYQKVIEYYDNFELKNKLTVSVNIANIIDKLPNQPYYLIRLNKKNYTFNVEGYQKVLDATNKYFEYELDNDIMTVLVSMSKAKLLRKAYPNYFLDTQAFHSVIGEIRQKQQNSNI